MQPIAVRRAGGPSPWQVQPEICRSGSSRCLTNPDSPPRRQVFELGDRLLALLSVRGGPAQDVLAAAPGVPEDLVSLCFLGKIELTDGKRRMRARGRAPGFWRKPQRLRRPAIGPTNECRRWQAGPEPPHRQRDAPACRSIRRQGCSRQDESGSDCKGWHGGPKTIASTPKRTVKRCLKGVSRIEALPLPFPLPAGSEDFSSEK